MVDQKAQAAARLRTDPALGEVVRALGVSLQSEVMTYGPTNERGQQAWLEYEALQRIVAAIDQMAQPALEGIQTDA